MALNRVRKVDDRVRIRNVIVSVYDKDGLDLLIPGLMDLSPDVRIFSTGGTLRAIRELLDNRQQDRVLSVSEYTGQPEMQGGLVKTLDYKIYLGLLSETYNEAHQEDIRRSGSIQFDMTVVNLYPFMDVIARPGTTLEDARTNIDIGGPCMLRASAKNFLRVLPVSSPADYGALLQELQSNDGSVSLETRYAFARKAFLHTAEYDKAIAEYLSDQMLSGGAYTIGEGR